MTRVHDAQVPPGEDAMIAHAAPIPTDRHTPAGEGAAGSSPQASTLPAAQSPDDVMQAAVALRSGVNWSSNGSVELIAQELLVQRRIERERCAEIAYDACRMREELYAQNGAAINAHKAVQAEEIAAAIRKGGTP